MIDKAKLQRLKEMHSKASPSPWHIGHVSEARDDENKIVELADIEDCEGCVVAEVEWMRDQSYICEIHNCLPELLDSINHMQKTIKEADEVFKKIAEQDVDFEIDATKHLECREMAAKARELLSPFPLLYE